MLRTMELNIRINDERILSDIDDLLSRMDIGFVCVEHENGKSASVDTRDVSFDRDKMKVTCTFEDSIIDNQLSIIEWNQTDKLSFNVFADWATELGDACEFGEGKVYLDGVQGGFLVRTDDVLYEQSQADKIHKILSKDWLVKQPEKFNISVNIRDGVFDSKCCKKALSFSDAILACLNRTNEYPIVKVEGHTRNQLLGLLV